MSDQPYQPPTDDRFAAAPEPPPGTENPPGAVAALVLGIVAIAIAFLGITSPVSVVLAIIGLVLAGKARRAAEAAPGRYVAGGVRIGGFVCSLIGLILGVLYLLITAGMVALFVVGYREAERAARIIEVPGPSDDPPAAAPPPAAQPAEAPAP